MEAGKTALPAAPFAPTDRILVAVDPQRWLPSLMSEVERATALDPKVRAALDSLTDRFGALSMPEQHELLTLLWAFARARLRAGLHPHLVCVRLSDGARTLALVDAALEEVFRRDSLNTLLAEGRRLMAAESDSAAELTRADTEVRRFISEANQSQEDALFVLSAIGALSTLVVLAEAEAAIHGHSGPLSGYHHPHH